MILADAPKGPNLQDEEDSWGIHEGFMRDSDIPDISLAKMRMILCVARYRSCRCIDWWRQYLGHSGASGWEGSTLQSSLGLDFLGSFSYLEQIHWRYQQIGSCKGQNGQIFFLEKKLLLKISIKNLNNNRRCSTISMKSCSKNWIEIVPGCNGYQHPGASSIQEPYLCRWGPGTWCPQRQRYHYPLSSRWFSL